MAIEKDDALIFLEGVQAFFAKADRNEKCRLRLWDLMQALRAVVRHDADLRASLRREGFEPPEELPDMEPDTDVELIYACLFQVYREEDDD